MRFRTKHIADSVTERISGIAESIRDNKPMPAPRGAATVALMRRPDGGLEVTKTFENGESELLTINSPTAIPPGFTKVEPAGQPATAAGIPGLVENVALGGDSIDSLLKG